MKTMKNRTFQARVTREKANRKIVSEPITVEIYDGVTIDLNYHGWATLCKGEGNTVYAVSSARIQHVDPFGAICFAKSTDGGESWEPARIIMDTPLDDRDAGIVNLGGGHLMIWWVNHDAEKYLEGDPKTHPYRHWRYNPARTPEQLAALDAKFAALTPEQARGGAYVAHSLDGGDTWGDPIRIPITCPHGPTLMNDGKTLLAAGLGWYADQLLDEPLPSHHFHLFKSFDGGYTWEKFCSVPYPPLLFGAVCEPHALQLRDGTILVAYRDSGKIRGVNDCELKTCVSRSVDGGKTWTEFERVPTVNGAPPHLLELSDGKVLLSYGCNTSPACGARVAVSDDGGETWSNEMVISVANNGYDDDLGYATSVQLDDGRILTGYYQKYEDEPNCSFLCTKWELIEQTGWDWTRQ